MNYRTTFCLGIFTFLFFVSVNFAHNNDLSTPSSNTLSNFSSILGNGLLSSIPADAEDQLEIFQKNKKIQELSKSPILERFQGWLNAYKNGNFSSRDEYVLLGEQLAAERLQALQQLAELDPQAALAKSIPPETLASLPASVAKNTEKPISARGDFLVFVIDKSERANREMHSSHIERQVVFGETRYKALVYGRRESMTTKLDIPLQGIIVGDIMVVDENPVRSMGTDEFSGEYKAEVGGEVVSFATEAEFEKFVREQIDWESKIGPERPSENLGPDELASTWTEGVKKVLVIRVDFPDKPGVPVDHYNQPLTETRANALFSQEVNPFYVNNSNNKTSLQATVTPVVRMPQLQTSYLSYDLMLADARNAARAAGFETNNFNLDVVTFSYSPAIGFVGIAALGSKGAMLNGAFYLAETAHELGHNYGLLHANLWRSVDGSVIGPGNNYEYYDCYDNMGACINGDALRHFNAKYKRLLDWMTDADVHNVTSNGVYRIYAHDLPNSNGKRALKINKNASKNYWVEFRQLFTFLPSAMNGALVRWDYASRNFRETQLLDMTPITTGAGDESLLIGQNFYDNENQIRISVLGKGNTVPESLDIRVEFGSGGSTPTPTPTPTPTCNYSISPGNQDFGSAGGFGNINVNTPAGCNWTAASGFSWITANGSGSGSGTLGFTVLPNSDPFPRTGSINIAGQTFTVTQAALVTSTPVMSINNISLNEGNSGLTSFNFTVTLSAPSTQTVSAIYSTADGTATAGSDYIAGNGVLLIAPGTTTKNFTISVIGDTIVEPDETFTVTLSGAGNATIGNAQGTAVILNDDSSSCSYSLSPSSAFVPVTGTNGTFQVQTSSGCSWAATSDSDWIIVNGSGSTSGFVSYSVQPNGGSARSGTISVNGQIFTVHQDGGCSYSISPSSAFAPATGINSTFQVQTSSGCSWTAVSDSNWITVNGSGSGSGFVSYTVQPNSNSPRSGTISVGGQIFTVHQDGGCSYTLVPSYTEIPANGGYSNMSIISSNGNCTWTAHSNDQWITITTAGSGTGTGTIDFMVAPNNGAVRTGSITVAGLLFTIMQHPASAPTVQNTLFDFDGDGKADVSVFRPSNGGWYLNQSTAGFNGIQFGISTDKMTPADFDGDGRTDLAVFRNGIWYLLRSQLGFTGVAFGTAGDIPAPADYDGDGKADIAVFRPSDGTWYINQSSAGFTSIQFGDFGDKPVAADYDGDGKADVAVFRNGAWYIRKSSLGFTAIAFGMANDKPVPADYDGDGKADVAVFRNGNWYLLGSQEGFTSYNFGIATDIPAPADFDGDGKADIAVFRSGTWYLRQSSQGFMAIQFGAIADQPVSGAFVH